MSKQTIANFEAEISKVCEKYRAKLTHAELVGVLDNVKVSYQIVTLVKFVDNTPSGKSPSPKEIKNAKKKES